MTLNEAEDPFLDAESCKQKNQPCIFSVEVQRVLPGVLRGMNLSWYSSLTEFPSESRFIWDLASTCHHVRMSGLCLEFDCYNLGTEARFLPSNSPFRQHDFQRERMFNSDVADSGRAELSVRCLLRSD